MRRTLLGRTSQEPEQEGRPSGRPSSSWGLPGWAPAAIIVVAALAIRLLAIGLDGGYEPLEDASDYHRHAVSIAAGEGYPDSFIVAGGGPSALRAPGYPYALGAAYAIAGDGTGTGRALGALLGALAVLLLYVVAARIWERRIALIAAGLAAVFPPLVSLSTELYSENLFIPLLLGSLFCVLRYRESGALSWAAAAGALAGLLALTRGPGVVVLLPLVFGLWSLRPRFGVRSLAGPAVGIVCAALLIAPWTLRNASEFDAFVPIATSSGFALAGTYNPDARDDAEHPTSWRNPVTVPEYAGPFADPRVDEAELDAELRREATDFARGDPAYVAEVGAHNLLRLFLLENDSVVSPQAELSGAGIGNVASTADKAALAIAAVLAGFGLWTLTVGRTGRIPKMPRGPLFLWLIPVALLLAAALVAGLPRYRIPADPFLLILAAIGVVFLLDRRGALPRGGAVAVIAALLLAGCGETEEDATTEALPEPSPGQTAFIARADRVCAEANRRAAQLVDAYQRSPGNGSTIETLSERLVRPGIEVRAEQAAELRALDPPEFDPDLDRFLGLFDPIEELTRLRLDAGLAEDAESVSRLDAVIEPIAEEQLEAARAYGMSDCSRDVLVVAFR